MKKHPKQLGSRGFTIIELLIATVVFSVVLLVILAAFIQISRLFYKGVNMSNTQNDTRIITQDIENDITFAAAPPSFTAITATTRPASGTFCIGMHLYQYQLGYQLGSSSGSNNYAIKRYNTSSSAGCNLAAATNPAELLGNGMQLNNINISCAVGRCLVNVHVIFYGGSSTGLFRTANSTYLAQPWYAPDAECTGSLTDSQYCATADYDRTVLLRS